MGIQKLLLLAIVAQTVWGGPYDQIERSPLQSGCARILSLLVRQTDPEILQYAPVGWGGGLCGPTCIVYGALAAAYVEAKKVDQTRIIIPRGDRYIKLFAKTRAPHPIGFGLSPEEMAQSASKFYKSLGYEDSVVKNLPADRISSAINPNKPGAFAILPISAVGPGANGKLEYKAGHHLFVTGIERGSSRIYYLDPNFPEQERVLTYQLDRLGKVYINGPELHYLLAGARYLVADGIVSGEIAPFPKRNLHQGNTDQ